MHISFNMKYIAYIYYLGFGVWNWQDLICEKSFSTLNDKQLNLALSFISVPQNADKHMSKISLVLSYPHSSRSYPSLLTTPAALGVSEDSFVQPQTLGKHLLMKKSAYEKAERWK